MRTICKWFFILFLNLVYSYNLIAQNIKVLDTVETSNPLKGDSSFTVEGEVMGKDSGTIKIFTIKNPDFIYVPFRQGKFYFSGIVNAPEQTQFVINGDYYNHSFYIEPGEIKIKYIYQQKFTARGTKENDLSNYFTDTLNQKNIYRFWDLGNKIETAFTDQNLDVYLKLIDSFKIVENDFFLTVDSVITQKKFGLYLLGCVNYHYINYSYFSKRKAIFERLPDYIKNSPAGRVSLDFLNFTIKKNTINLNAPAYKFSLSNIKKQKVRLRDYKGKIIVLDFWASWCVPCIKALPMLKKINVNPVSKDVIYLSVSIDKNEKAWKTTEQKITIPWSSVLADKLTINKYKVKEVPNYIVIDKNGIIVSRGTSLGNLYTKLKELNN